MMGIFLDGKKGKLISCEDIGRTTSHHRVYELTILINKKKSTIIYSYKRNAQRVKFYIKN